MIAVKKFVIYLQLKANFQKINQIISTLRIFKKNSVNLLRKFKGISRIIKSNLRQTFSEKDTKKCY